jgi:bifunctional non-homologous end joining protein LigD
MSNLNDVPPICHRDLMLATPGKLFTAPGCIFELKYDGLRALACKRGDLVRLESRNGRDMSSCFPEVAEAVRAIPGDIALDGELVIGDEMGRPQWDRLQKRHVIRQADRTRQAAAAEPAAIFAFDLLHLKGTDYRSYPLRLRKAVLRDVLARSERMKCAQHMPSPVELWALANHLELEGIVAKQAQSAYVAGRTTYWQKIKTEAGAERERQRRAR